MSVPECWFLYTCCRRFYEHSRQSRSSYNIMHRQIMSAVATCLNAATQLSRSTPSASIVYRLQSVSLAVGTSRFLGTYSLAGVTVLILLPDLWKIKDKRMQPSHFNQMISRQQVQKSPGKLRETDLHMQVSEPHTHYLRAHNQTHAPKFTCISFCVF